MATLRDLIRKCSYKSVFNILYKEYYKDKPDSEVQCIDVSYLKVYDNLIKKEYKPNKEYQIYINDGIDNFSGEKKQFINVSLYCNDDDEIYAIDLTPWDELIDANIINKTKLDDISVVAHILWEITFYGFTDEVILSAKRNLQDQISRIEKGEEDLIPWEDIKEEFGIDKNKS